MRIVKIFITTMLLFITNILNAQSNFTVLKVIDINELDNNVFEIRALKQSRDTIRILSKKEDINNSYLYEKIQEGTEYQFELKPEPYILIT